jgi:anaerobic C4-dicarboxylate transporter
VAWRGKDLKDDPIYQEKLKSGQIKKPTAQEKPSMSDLKNAKGSTIVFFLAIIFVVFVGIFPEIRPTFTMFNAEGAISGQVDMGDAIMITMLAAAGFMMIFFKAKAAEAVSGSIMRGGIVAVISILGISWLGSSFFEGNRLEIVGAISGVVQHYPWLFAMGLFVLSILLFSQAATIVTLMPIAVALNLPAALLIGVYPAVNGYFFLPTYGTILAAVSFDPTGTTKIGKYLLNHSFMLPGLVTTISANKRATGFG